VPSLPGLYGFQRKAFTFKSLEDAFLLRI